MRTFMALLLAMMFIGCSVEPDPEEMLRLHVAPVPISSVKDIQWGQARCMHCPLYFSFEADEQFVSALVKSHQMHEVSAISEDIVREEEIVKRSAGWWKMADINNGDKVYWVKFESKFEGADSIFRLLVVDKDRFYFIKRGWLEERKE